MDQDTFAGDEPGGRVLGRAPALQTVVLVDAHVTYRQSLGIAITKLMPNFHVIGESDNAREALVLIEDRHPDLAVLDFLLPDSNGTSLILELRRRRLRTKTLILTGMLHPFCVANAMGGGAGGFAFKQEPLAGVLAAIERVGQGERYLSPHLPEALPVMLDSDVPGLGQLSAREREVLFLLIEGRSSKAIAKSLFVSPKTVDTHRLHINRKLGVRSPAALTRLVVDHGLLEL
jgi:DNA-binding NarL/FixJ family response regulator